MTAALHVRDLLLTRESRGQRFELHVAALDLVAGEVLAVLGPNGAGKSTLLRALAGLDTPAAGVVECAAEGPVTMVFQRPIAFAGSVQHNVRIALRARGLERAEIQRRCETALERFGIGQLAGRRAAALSGGELRRLALARAFALEPAVLLLDEPFDDLDAAARERLSRDLRQAVALTGVAAAVVSHDLRRAALVCDRIAVLLGGRLRQLGPREEVLARPADAAVARLVGMGNLLPATLASDGFAAVDATHRIPNSSALPPGTAVFVGLRPEHVKVDIGRGEGEPIGKARVVEHTSDSVLTTLVVEWGGHSLRTHLVAGRGLARELRVGDTVSLSLRPEDVHVLPRDEDSR